MKKALLLLALLCAPLVHAKLSPLAPRPDWTRLDAFQETMTREEFAALLDRVYAPGGAAAGIIELQADAAIIRTGPGKPAYTLRFAPTQDSARRAATFWKRKAELPPPVAGKPLSGLRIAIDPGHLGGDWAKVEERWFQIGNATPVTEGDMTLKVAKLLVPRLTALGASVYLTRSKPGPVTSRRPGQLREAAVASLRDKGDSVSKQSVTKESERLFYRASEIRRRATLVNEAIRPDVVLCLHFNAEAWGNEKKPTFVPQNHLHFLITGAWSRSELEYEDQRLDMLVKLLSRSFREEKALTEAMATQMARATGLPPYTYEGGSVVRVGDNPYIWARNLLANRLFACPVVYAEPYVMNNRLVYQRIQVGDYDGKRTFGGIARKSIYREYADALTDGLVAYYSQR